ncbi:disulfide bond formation protein B [Thiospirillum jenense]|uniref:Disulfide bond formation protein B n=1 Tax=Thiospirillum jenense TaxID=1653858 RepID=A0A839HFU0_9GAMM|nr:disulfide bond formation protein B [Thiospirillum jenense]MBB1127274.1 disulfide bond formation protein B [Thiospirillum jenense]
MHVLLLSIQRHLWLVLTITSGMVVTISLILPAVFNLEPCYLCIFQRLLWIIMTGLGMIALFGHNAITFAGRLFIFFAGMGISAAGYQSWLQWQPIAETSCVGSTPGLIDRLVEWLGEQLPALFLATGFCEDAALFILGFSLANWAFIMFMLALIGALIALHQAPISNRIN